MDPQSLLFSGVRIDKRRFSADIARFEKKRKSDFSNANGENAGEDLELKDIPSLKKKLKIRAAGDNVPQPLRSFQQLSSEYDCEPNLIKNLVEAGYKEPTPVQRQVIPVLLQERECFVCAPTGSGKSLAFILPILMKLKKSSPDGIRAVILCPTRELAAQLITECRRLANGSKIRARLLTKRLFKNPDFASLRCDILVSTPLRLDKLVKSEKIDLKRVEYFILDESDKLFELGFMQQIDSIVSACTRTNIVRALFSATLPETVEELARTIMHDAIRIVIGDRNSASETVQQKLMYAGNEEGKLLALKQFFKEGLSPPIILFVQCKERAKQLHKALLSEKLRVDSIHADRTQTQREIAVLNFRTGKTWILIATDLMARGMDFKGVNWVINYDVPQDTTVYIHRIGRSGRAGRPGNALTLYAEEDVPLLRSIANVMKASGCDVPEWMLSLPKIRKRNQKRIRRQPVGASA
ncbi:DEAD-box ATP-dependent RNA helicase 57 [Selaginella moellendorffii]|nr:DEAD-box ATP-dependent RNA helicase 57 [Selaginella moellendorffii]|eukprot:XP_002986837.2 DEAD-box ATP-dependent RNA helicase 57 [Selaginella moellendorffii]